MPHLPETGPEADLANKRERDEAYVAELGALAENVGYIEAAAREDLGPRHGHMGYLDLCLVDIATPPACDCPTNPCLHDPWGKNNGTRISEEFIAAFDQAAKNQHARAEFRKTFGGQMVRMNRYDSPEVYEIKEHFAAILNVLNRDRSDPLDNGRLLSIAITEAEGACLWAVKALTR